MSEAEENTKLSAADKLYGSKSSALPQKMLMQLLSWSAVAMVAYMLFGGGLQWLAGKFDAQWDHAVDMRAYLIILCSAIYAFRLVITQFVLIKRTMPWGETMTISIWLWVIHSTFVFFGGRNGDPVSWVTWLGLGLYFLGSYFNTGGELMRHFWKKKPESKGKLYTQGLFKYSMHINYFGDFVLFTGFTLVAGVVWTFAIPLIMASLFIFVNIPMLDEYLAKRYGEQFTEYASKTKKFFPFIY